MEQDSLPAAATGQTLPGAMPKDVAVSGILSLLTLYVQQSHIRGLTQEEQTHFQQLNSVSLPVSRHQTLL